MVECFLGPPVWQSCKKRDALHLTPPHNPAAASSDVIEERAMNKMKKMMITKITMIEDCVKPYFSMLTTLLDQCNGNSQIY